MGHAYAPAAHTACVSAYAPAAHTAFFWAYCLRQYGPDACEPHVYTSRIGYRHASIIDRRPTSIAGRWRRNDHYANVPRCMLTCTSIWACRDNYTRHTGVHTPEKKNAGKCIFLATIASKKTIYYRHRTVSLSCRRPGWAAESIFCRSRNSRTRSGAKETAM